MGLPLFSLEGIGAVLKLQDQKLKKGKDLIRYFCTPCKPTKANVGRTRNLPQNHLPDLEQARQYVIDGDYEMLDLLYDSVPSVLSELIKTAYRPGHQPRHPLLCHVDLSPLLHCRARP